MSHTLASACDVDGRACAYSARAEPLLSLSHGGADLGAFTESERVVGSWSGLKCGTAHTVRYATFEERRAAAVLADVQRCTELRFSRFQ